MKIKPYGFALDRVRRAVEEPDEGRRGDDAVGVLAELRDLIPVDLVQQAHPDPTPVPDIGRPEEDCRVTGDECRLGAGRGGPQPLR